MNPTLKYVSVLILLGFTILFNIVLVDIRFSEINYLLGKIASRDRISNTFSIVAKYELIKRRMLFGEDQNSDYELEAKIQALTSGNQFENQRTPIEKKNLSDTDSPDIECYPFVVGKINHKYKRR